MANYTPLNWQVKKPKNLQLIAFGTICVAFMFFLGQINETSKCQEVIKSSMLMETTTRNYIELKDFKKLNHGIFQERVKVCDCGCAVSPNLNCPRKYSLADVEKSAYAVITRDLSESMETELVVSKTNAQISCLRDGQRSEIGYCLSAMVKLSEEEGLIRGSVSIPFPAREIQIPKSHMLPSDKLLETLYGFIESEEIKSINDFGAGIGQYGVSLRRKFQEKLLYRGYDGAGDVEIYTLGFVKYYDLTIPMKLPVADWVMSFEVGHLIPVHKEGMMIRNLHAHNCKGILISWGAQNADGFESNNLHDEEYLVDLFTKLGYFHDLLETERFRENWTPEEGDGMWFHESLLVFRRHKPIC